MTRRKFIAMAGGAAVAGTATSYMASDRRNLTRADTDSRDNSVASFLQPVEQKILTLASLAPSGHNTQPWFVRYIEPRHWIVGNDKTRWLPAVDPNQRETILSIGAFIQTLEYAARAHGYVCVLKLLASTNQAEEVMDVRLETASPQPDHISRIIGRRTVRSGFLGDLLSTTDHESLFSGDGSHLEYFPRGGVEATAIANLTLNANRIQVLRDPAQSELAQWIRFSSSEAAKHRDGLTTGSMEIDGLSGWVVRNFYDSDTVMGTKFRNDGLGQVSRQINEGAGWILITSDDESIASLLDAGRCMQRLSLRARAKGIAVHPMTQILEEAPTQTVLNQTVAISKSIQFILRIGYIEIYPTPVSLRRPVNWFVRT